MQNNQLIGLVIKKDEKEELHRLCLEYDVPILYEELFSDNQIHYLWAFNENGIGLIGTYIIQTLPKVLHGTKEFEEYLIRQKIFDKIGFKHVTYSRKSGSSIIFPNKEKK